MPDSPLSSIIAPAAANAAQDAPLWSGQYKIPWNDPEFSRRMLAEHLSQGHDMASRRQDRIDAVTAWVRETVLADAPEGSVLDLGCGPGLYSRGLADGGRAYLGIDFGPASIEHAKSAYGSSDRRFVLADVLTADFEGPHALVAMLYGEFNVFAPEEAERILAKAHAALAPGGTLLMEVYDASAVRAIGDAPNTWYRAPSGLFADVPHLCMIESAWFDKAATARQLFHVVETARQEPTTYASTTKAWTDDEYAALVTAAGFDAPRFHVDVPGREPSFKFLTARKR